MRRIYQGELSDLYEKKKSMYSCIKAAAEKTVTIH